METKNIKPIENRATEMDNITLNGTVSILDYSTSAVSFTQTRLKAPITSIVEMMCMKSRAMISLPGSHIVFPARECRPKVVEGTATKMPNVMAV